MRYSAFISYNHQDRSWANWLHRTLESYRLPQALVGRESAIGTLGKKLPPAFQDREELAASSDLSKSIREALDQAHCLVVICSSSGAASRWVNQEVAYFIELGRAHRIQCLIVPEASDPEGSPKPTSEVFPPALLALDHEPLAADARVAGDGKRNAFLKLVAGVLGVRYDELRQREQIRRQRRLVTIAVAASIGFVSMSGLAGFALASRAEAVRERDLARQKSITAQQTVDFVKGLFSVSDPSEAKGENITAREVLDRGAQQIEASLSTEPDVKAELASTLSEVYAGLGSYRRADDLIRRSLRIPVQSRETRARQLSVLAASMVLQGNYEQGVTAYGQALKMLGNPEDLRNPALFSGALLGRAEALASIERFPEAKRSVDEAIRWDTARTGAQSPEVARGFEAAGLVHQFAGDLKASRAAYLKALALRVAAQGKFHPKVSEDLNELGAISYMQGNATDAERFWRQSIVLDQRVLGPDHPDVAATINNLARLMVEQRRFEEAVPLLERSVRINLAQRADTHDDLAFIFSNLAMAKAALGEQGASEELFRRALRSAEIHKHRARAPIRVDLAELRCSRGDQSEGLRLLAEAAPIMKEDYPDDAWRVAWVDNTRGACLLSSNAAEAKRLIRASAPPILERWGANTLYGAKVRERLQFH